MTSEGASENKDRAGIAEEFLFSLPAHDLLAFGKLMRKFRPPYSARVWHITVLARGLGWNYPTLARAASAMPFRDRVHLHLHSLGERLLHDQLERITPEQRLFGILPIGKRHMHQINHDLRSALAKSLLATTIRYRSDLNDDHREDLYAHSLISHGLLWACVCLEDRRNMDSVHLSGEEATQVPVLEPNEVNRAIFQALGVS
jgi:hypothetical protein